MNKILLLLAAAAVAGCQTTAQPARVLYPVERCGYVNQPVYGVLDRPTSGGEVAGGAVIGGVIANQISDHNPAATVLGAIIGGAVANSQRVQTPVVVGQKKVWQCQTVYE